MNGATVYVRDVAHVRDGYPPQTNIVRQDGQRAVLMTIMKTGSGIHLDIVKRVHEHAAARCRPRCRRNCKIKPLSDQSIFVRASINGVMREGVDRGLPDGADDPALPGELAHTLIIAISIPLSILSS